MRRECRVGMTNVTFRNVTSGALLGGVKRSFRAVRIASFNEISSHLPSDNEMLITNPLSIWRSVFWRKKREFKWGIVTLTDWTWDQERRTKQSKRNEVVYKLRRSIEEITTPSCKFSQNSQHLRSIRIIRCFQMSPQCTHKTWFGICEDGFQEFGREFVCT